MASIKRRPLPSVRRNPNSVRAVVDGGFFCNRLLLLCPKGNYAVVEMLNQNLAIVILHRR